MAKRVQSMSRFTRASRRARGLFVLAACIALVAFVGVPLIYNGTLFGSPVHDEVYAAPPNTPLPTLTPTIELDPAPIVFDAEEEPTPEPEVILEYPILKYEDDDPAVSALQERLMDLGYFDYDMVTTYYGTVTKSSIELFQRAHGLNETGIADSETQALLYSVDAQSYHMKPGDKGSDIRSMQRRLSELGYYEEKDNGYFGVATERAVKKFQERNKIEQTGIINQDVAHLLYSPKARPLVDPTPTPTKKPTPSPTKKPTPTPSIPVIEKESGSSGSSGNGSNNSSSSGSNSNASYGTGVSAMIAAAKAQLGKPYILGDDGPDSYDCSGLVYYCLRAAGVSIGRYSAANYAQITSWDEINSLNKCKAGDLLFFKSDKNSNISHTGIYLGNGQFIHAATSAGKVLISSCTDYYQRNFVLARRVF